MVSFSRLTVRRTLYDCTSVTSFVAGFIGSPQMNFMDADLIKEGNNVYLKMGDYKITVTPEKAAKCADYIGKTVTFGVRPEDVYAAAKYEKS